METIYRQITRNKIVIFLFFTALISGFFWNQKTFGQPIGSDQTYFDGVASDILNYGWFIFKGQETFTEPFYPLFLAGIYAVFGHNYDAVRIIQIVLFALTVILIYLLASGIFDKKIAFWSAFATTLFYGLANQAGNILTETLFTFLVVLFAYIIYMAYWRNKIFWYALSGFVLGLATLTKGMIQFLPLLVILSMFAIYFKKIPIRKILVKATVFLILFLIVLFPWFMRGGTNIGSAVAPRGGGILTVRAELMENLYPDYLSHFIGHLFGYYFVQKFNPGINPNAFRLTPQSDKRTDDLIKEGKTYNEADKILMEEAKSKILAAPHKYFLMSVIDLVSFNSPIIISDSLWGNSLTVHTTFADGRHPEIPEWAKTAILLGIRFAWFLFLGLVIYALVKNLKNWREISWLFIIIFYFNLSYSAVHAIPRYALPIYPFYVILAVAGVTYFYNKYAEKQK